MLDKVLTMTNYKRLDIINFHKESVENLLDKQKIKFFITTKDAYPGTTLFRIDHREFKRAVYLIEKFLMGMHINTYFSSRQDNK